MVLQMKNSAWQEGTSSTSPCRACKLNRKKCSEKCVLAPYFPQDDPQKFLFVHRVFENGRIVKLLRDLLAEQRGDAVSSMVYEARQRIQDAVHGCVGVINNLEKKITELQSRVDYYESYCPQFYNGSLQESEEYTYVLDHVDPLALWEPIWM